jgi:hypothetical protein
VEIVLKSFAFFSSQILHEINENTQIAYYRVADTAGDIVKARYRSMLGLSIFFVQYTILTYGWLSSLTLLSFYHNQH